MKLNSLTLEGFQTYYEREHIDLDGLTLTAIIGSNYSGKSSLFDAIEWVLYGRCRGDNVYSVVSRGADQCRVTVEFTLGDARYEITRTRPMKGRVEVFVRVQTGGDWKNLVEKDPKFADPYIVELLGMNAETARATWIIGQNDVGAFCELKPSPRRTLLARMFGLDKYEELATKAKENRGRVDGEIAAESAVRDRMRQELERLQFSDGPLADKSDDELVELAEQAEIEDERATRDLGKEVDPQKAEDAVSRARADLREYRDRFDQQARQHEQRKVRLAQQVDSARTQIVNAEAQVASADDRIAAAQKAHDAAEAAEWDVPDMESRHAEAVEAVEAASSSVEQAEKVKADHLHEVTRITAEQKALTVKAEEIGQQVTTLRTSIDKHEGECFTCGQDLTEEDAEALVRRQEEQKQALRDDYKRCSEKIAALKGDAADADRAIAEVRDGLKVAQRAERDAEAALTRVRALADGITAAVKAVEDAWASRDAAVAGLESAKGTLRSAESEQADLGEAPETPDEARLAELNEAVRAAQEVLDDARNATEARNSLQAARSRARQQERDVWTEQERRSTVQAQSMSVELSIDESVSKIERLERDRLHYDTLHQAFQPSGIPALMLTGIVDELNTDANAILGRLGSELGVEISMRREKQSGGVEEKVTVVAQTPSGDGDFSTLSGAEKFQIALALRCAMAQAVNRRTGIPMQTFILDEGWGALDEGNIRAVQDMLAHLSEEFAVFTVSHIRDVKDSFSTVIEVERSSGTSRVAVSTR